MSTDRQHSIRQSLVNEIGVEVMPGTGGVCVVYTPSIFTGLHVRAMLASIGVYPYRSIPANFRSGYYTIFIL